MKMKNKLLCSLFCILIANLSFGQENLVNNPSFEEITSCPSNYEQINYSVGWGILQTGGGGPPDF